MPTMKIRGGDLDLVEYEFNPFPPGQNLKTLGYEKTTYLLKPAKGKIIVKAPARIHLTVLDMNRFAPDHPGGGGSGLPSRFTARQKSNAQKKRPRSITTVNRSFGTLSPYSKK